MTAAYDIRRARPDDAEAVAAMHATSARTAYADLLDDDVLGFWEPDTRIPYLRARFAGAEPFPVTLVAARPAGAVDGFCTVGPCRDEGAAGEGEVHAMYVAPAAWGTGLAGRLMTAGLDRLAAAGMEPVSLWVIEANARARGFYERCGFRRDEVRFADDLRVPLLRMVRRAPHT